MKCKSCGFNLPDDSVFCQYCGQEIIKDSVQKNKEHYAMAAIIEQTEIENGNQHVNPEDNKPETVGGKKITYCKKCGGAVDPNNKKCIKCGKQYFKLSVIIPIGYILTAVLGIALIVAVIFYNQRINSLETDFDTVCQVRDEYIQKYNAIYPEYSFYHDYAVIVWEGVTNYHSYGCLRATDSFWIYNTEAAKGRDYDPCPLCQ